VSISIGSAALTFAGMPALAVLFRIAARHGYVRAAPFVQDWLVVAVVNAVLSGMLGQFSVAFGAAASAVVAAVILWWQRRRPDRAARSFGAESRARIADLVRTMRQRSIRRPVLHPAPGGAW
jgi:hypothetical protein